MSRCFLILPRKEVLLLFLLSLFFISLPSHIDSLVSRLSLVPVLVCHIVLGLPYCGIYLTLLYLHLVSYSGCLLYYKLPESRKGNQFTRKC